MPAAPKLQGPERKALAEKGLRDPVWFCKFFLQQWFPSPMPWVHRGILAILTRRCEFLEAYGELDKIIDNFTYEKAGEVHHIFFLDPEGHLHMKLQRFTLLLIPRGFSKTTLANAANIYNLCYRSKKFLLYVSETGTHATNQLTNVTRQVTGNPLLLEVFGNPQPPQRGRIKLKWSESDGMVQTTTGITVKAIGRGGQARGQNVDAARPDMILVDDVEDKESVATPEQRMKALEWFYGDLLPSLPELDPSASISMLATLLHRDALAQHVKIDPDWTVVEFGIFDKAGDPIWPAMIDAAKAERKKQRYALQGLLHIFYLEFHNQIRSPEDAKFRPEFINVAPIELSAIQKWAMALDPAISNKLGSDSSAIAAVGMCLDGVIQVVETVGGVGWTARKQIDEFFKLHFRLGLDNGAKHGIESIAFQAALVHLMKEEMFRWGKTHGPSAYFEVVPIMHNTAQKKEARVEGVLQPRYAAGYIRHQRHFPELETQLLDWPSGKKDYPDVAAMAITLLDDAAAYAAGDVEEELPDLGEWRQY